MQNLPRYDHVAGDGVSDVMPGISIVGESLVESADQGIIARSVDSAAAFIRET